MSEGFAKIRNGLKDHIDQGKMSATDIGVYTFLHLYCTWKTGIWFGNALNIASKTLSSRRSISDSLHRLRQRGYINYASTRGKRGSYYVLIHKFEPQYGPWGGYRLNAWKYTDKVEADYEKIPDHERWKEQSESSAVHSEGVDGAMTPPRDRLDGALTPPPRCLAGASLPEQQMLQTGQTVAEGAEHNTPTPEDVSCCSPSPSAETQTPNPTPQEVIVSGFKLSEIKAHLDHLVEFGHKWATENADGINRLKPKWVEHIMSLKVPKGAKRRFDSYAEKSQDGLCVDCGKAPREEFNNRCEDCLDKFNPAFKKEPEPCWYCEHTPESKGKRCAFHEVFVPKIKACSNCVQVSKSNTEMCQAHVAENKVYMDARAYEGLDV